MGTHPLRKQFITPKVQRKVYNSLKTLAISTNITDSDSVLSSDSVFSSGKQVESALKITPSQLPKRQTVLPQDIKKPMFSTSLFSVTGLTLRFYNMKRILVHHMLISRSIIAGPIAFHGMSLKGWAYQALSRAWLVCPQRQYTSHLAARYPCEWGNISPRVSPKGS